MSDTVKYLLDEEHLPKSWYNINADLPVPLDPVLHPGTQQPITADELGVIFPRAVIEQEMSTEREIEIPEPVRAVYRQWRPSPLFRARRLEKALNTPAKIYYKYEGVSPAGSHKPNTAIPQAFYNKQEGVKRIATETGAGQWGSSLALAGSFFGLEIVVYMVKVSYQQKPYRRAFMEAFGAQCIASPSDDHRLRPRHPGRAPGQHRQPRHRHQRGGRGRRPARRHQVRPGQRAEPRPAAPDRHRDRVDAADGDGRRLARHDHRLHRRRQQLCRARLPLSGQAIARGRQHRSSSRWSPPPARP